MIVSVLVAESVVDFDAGLRREIVVAVIVAVIVAVVSVHDRTKGASQSTTTTTTTTFVVVVVSFQGYFDFPGSRIRGIQLKGLVSLGGNGGFGIVVVVVV